MTNNPTIDTYNKYAQAYDQEVIDFWDNFPKKIVDDFCAALPGNTVLDLGSGSGRDALLLREHGLQVTCVDGSEAMVAMTKSLGFVSHLMDFSELAFEPGSFDGAWAYTSLIHIPKDQAGGVLRHVHELLRPKGVLLFGAINGEGERIVERKTMPDTQRFFRFYTPDELQGLVETAGFVFLSQENYQPHNSVYLNQLYKRN
jgi:SAM-dependent methyltransferase